MQLFKVFSRETLWLSSSWDLQQFFLRDLMHCKLQISFSHGSATFLLAIFPLFSSCFEWSWTMNILHLCLVTFPDRDSSTTSSFLHLKECALHTVVARGQISWEIQQVWHDKVCAALVAWWTAVFMPIQKKHRSPNWKDSSLQGKVLAVLSVREKEFCEPDMASYWRHKDQQGRTSICFALSLVLLTKLGLKSKEGDKTRT